MTQPLVLIPGLMTTRDLFAHQAEDLAGTADVLIADITAADTVEALAASVLETAPERFVLGGLSMGGYVALEIMRQAPRRVSALALLDTSARPDTPEQSEGRARLVAVARKRGMAAVVRELFPKLVDPDRKDDEALARSALRMAEAVGVEAFARQQAANTTRPDSRPTLDQIDCPTLVLVGDRDQITPPPLAEEMTAAIADARLEMIPHCGHLSSLERPEEVSAALQRLVERVQ